jgi:hypothetical protein
MLASTTILLPTALRHENLFVDPPSLIHESTTLQNGEGVMVVDAGGGTVDICAYGQSSDSSSKCEEIMASECQLFPPTCLVKSLTQHT